MRVRGRWGAATTTAVDVSGNIDEIGGLQAAQRNNGAAALELRSALIAVVRVPVTVPPKDKHVASVTRNIDFAGYLEAISDVDDKGLRRPVLCVQAIERSG